MKKILMLAIVAPILFLMACDQDDGPIATPTPTPTPAPSPTPSALVPAKGESAAFVDTRLQLSFDAAPTLGTKGLIKIFRSDGTLVDTIDVGTAIVDGGGETQTTFARANTEIDKIGNNVSGLTQWRFTYYRPVTINGNRVAIKLHDGVLANDTRYYVTIDPGVLTGRIGGTDFTGFASATDWTFTTKPAPASKTSVIVDDDGAADFRSVQGALDWMMANGCVTCANAADAKTISVRNGIYDEQLFLRGVNNLTITGESREGTIVRTDNSDAFNSGTGGSRTAPNTTFTNIGGASALGTRRVLGGGRSVLLIEGSDLIKLSTFTIQNTHIKDKNTNGQAEAIYFNSATLAGSRFTGTDMNFLGTQDTLQMKGWVWIYNSLITGDVDFVWGYPFAFLIENSELRTVVDTANPGSGGYVFQARAAKGYPGFVVLNSTLTAAAGVPAGATYLARSGGVGQAGGYCLTPAVTGRAVGNGQLYCDNVAYVNTRMGFHIAPTGWSKPPLPNLAPTETEGWRESGSLNADGSPANLAARDTSVATTSATLSGIDSRSKIFASWNDGAGWIPK